MNLVKFGSSTSIKKLKNINITKTYVKSIYQCSNRFFSDLVISFHFEKHFLAAAKINFEGACVVVITNHYDDKFTFVGVF